MGHNSKMARSNQGASQGCFCLGSQLCDPPGGTAIRTDFFSDKIFLRFRKICDSLGLLAKLGCWCRFTVLLHVDLHTTLLHYTHFCLVSHRWRKSWLCSIFFLKISFFFSFPFRHSVTMSVTSWVSLWLSRIVTSGRRNSTVFWAWARDLSWQHHLLLILRFFSTDVVSDVFQGPVSARRGTTWKSSTRWAQGSRVKLWERLRRKFERLL